MAERKLEVTTKIDSRIFFYTYPLGQFAEPLGFSLKFVSGPPSTEALKPGWWLQQWITESGKRGFQFGPEKLLAFESKETAIAVKEELQKAVDIITEVTE
jgi:hypothetical protein